jgi:hypothetical protein
MPRKLRVEYPGAIYHLMNRGDRREPIFRDDEDRKLFLSTLIECGGRVDGGGPEVSAEGRREEGAHCAAFAG